MNRRKNLGRVVSLLTAVSLTGCYSWITRAEPITLEHTARQSFAVAGAHQVTVNVQVNDRRNYLAPGISRKWGKAVVGYGRNPLGEEIAPTIIVVEPVELTVEKSVENELTARGFRVGADAAFKIVIDIDVFFNDYRIGFLHQESVADLQMTVLLLSRDGRRLYARPIATQGRNPKVGTKYARLALNTALDNGIDTLFSDWTLASTLLSAGQPPPLGAAGGRW